MAARPVAVEVRQPQAALGSLAGAEWSRGAGRGRGPGQEVPGWAQSKRKCCEVPKRCRGMALSMAGTRSPITPPPVPSMGSCGASRPLRNLGGVSIWLEAPGDS